MVRKLLIKDNYRERQAICIGRVLRGDRPTLVKDILEGRIKGKTSKEEDHDAEH